MPVIMECGMEYALTDDEADKLEQAGFIVHSSDGDWYDTTAMLWDDFTLEGKRAFRLFDLILDRRESRYEARS